MSVMAASPRNVVLTWWLTLTLLISSSATEETRTRTNDVACCQGETFTANCSDTEVVSMTRARYGRMRIGRCINRDYGYIGCSVDVLRLADRQCSGRPDCSIMVPNSALDETTPCPRDLESYFEAGYECIQVETAPEQICDSSVISLSSKSSGFLSEHVAMETGKGSMRCPWLLQGQAGQRVNFTLLNFDTLSTSNHDVCRVYAIVREMGVSHNICFGNSRLAYVFASTTHAVEVQIIGPNPNNDGHGFSLLKFEMIGCPDPDVPHGEMERHGDTLVVKCRATAETWYLSCEGNTWRGSYVHCSPGCLDPILPDGMEMERHGDALTVRCIVSGETWLLVCQGDTWIGSYGNCSQEYCETEIFEASCSDTEVVYMTRALYGRMRLGRCISTDLGYVGCSADVLPLADRQCSGRPSCRIRMPNSAFDELRPCSPELKNYLEAGYECIKVETAPDQTCDSSAISLSNASGFLSEHIAMETGKGSSDCPWLLQAQAGQRVNLTLVNVDTLSSSHPSVCHVYAVIREIGVSQTICRGRTRLAHVYTSTTHAVEVRIVGSNSVNDDHGFSLLKYEMIGCPDPDLPDGMVMERHEDTLVVKCRATNETWHLVCEGNTWHGSYGNCSQVIGCPDPDLPDGMVMERHDTLVVKCRATNETWHLVCEGNTWHGSYGNCSQDDPVMVAFYVKTCAFGGLSTEDTIIPFNNVQLNIANGYNSNSGIFTAPTHGLYHISYAVRASHTICGADPVCAQLNVNGKAEMSYCSTYDSCGGRSVVLELGAGDIVCVAIRHRDPCQQLDHEDHNMFSGYLIQKINNV